MQSAYFSQWEMSRKDLRSWSSIVSPHFHTTYVVWRVNTKQRSNNCPSETSELPV